jgi:hypothetical protein
MSSINPSSFTNRPFRKIIISFFNSYRYRKFFKKLVRIPRLGGRDEKSYKNRQRFLLRILAKDIALQNIATAKPNCGELRRWDQNMTNDEELEVRHLGVNLPNEKNKVSRTNC